MKLSEIWTRHLGLTTETEKILTSISEGVAQVNGETIFEDVELRDGTYELGLFPKDPFSTFAYTATVVIIQPDIPVSPRFRYHQSVHIHDMEGFKKQREEQEKERLANGGIPKLSAGKRIFLTHADTSYGTSTVSSISKQGEWQ